MLRRQRNGLFGVLALGLGLLPARLAAQEDENGVYVLMTNHHSKETMAKAYAEIPPVRLDPPGDRWARLPRTAAILGKRNSALKIVMLGDSIVNDTSQSRWEDIVEAMYPSSKITKVTCVRGATGCWWYKEAGRVKRYVLDLKPDLLVIGGISHKDDTDSIRDVVRQVRAGSKCDILLMTGAFGFVDPRDDKQWSYAVDPAGKDFRARLRQVAIDEKTAFFDMTAHWGKYIRESGKDLNWFKRDAVHANERGMQVMGRLLAACFAPPVTQN
jgi:lysophospholipase L1-like esterase